MEIQDVRNNLETLPDEIEKAEFAFLEQRAILEFMEDMKKNSIALEKLKHEGTNVEKETKAHASAGYKIYFEGIQAQSIKVAELAAKFHGLQNKFEGMRSLNKNV